MPCLDEPLNEWGPDPTIPDVLFRLRRTRHLMALRPLQVIPLAVALLLATPGVAVAKPSPDTIIDSGPASPTSATTASFTFHSTFSGATNVAAV